MIQKRKPVFSLRAIRHAYPEKPLRRVVLRSLNHSFFPITFFVRNMAVLEGEPRWKLLSPSARKDRVYEMLLERANFFQEVKDWLTRKEGGLETHFLPHEEASPSLDRYCTHCGGCCEIASGLPDFPPDVPIPQKWKYLFGQGLGAYHRFCPFLWEKQGTGQSFCAIHPWRSLPCRAFEREECEYFLNG